MLARHDTPSSTTPLNLHTLFIPGRTNDIYNLRFAADARRRLGGRLLPKVGELAPDFELPAVTGTQRHTFKLSDYRGKKHVVLAFYALDWSPT